MFLKVYERILFVSINLSIVRFFFKGEDSFMSFFPYLDIPFFCFHDVSEYIINIHKLLYVKVAGV